MWVGDVLIRAAAEGTRTYELNRNLLLSEGAGRLGAQPRDRDRPDRGGRARLGQRPLRRRAALLPHGAGIPHDQARRLVVRGFFADVVGRISVPDVEAEVMAAVEAELARS